MKSYKNAILNYLGELDSDETAEVAAAALDLMGITQIVTLVLELDTATKQELLEALADEGDAA
jgi:hypothetical protein